MVFSIKSLLLGFLSTVFFFLFLFSINTLFTINAIDATLLNKDFVVTLLDKHIDYDAIYDDFVTALVSKSLGVQSAPLVDSLKGIFPSSSLKLLVDRTVSSFVGFFRNPGQDLPVFIIPKNSVIQQELRASFSDLFGLQTAQTLKEVKNYVQLMLSFQTILLASALVLLVLLALIPKTLPQKLRRVGQALLAAGIGGLTAFLALDFLVPALPLPLPQLPGAGLAKALSNILIDLGRGVGQSMLWQAGPLFALGIIAIIASYVIDWKQSKRVEAQPAIQQPTIQQAAVQQTSAKGFTP